MAESIEEENNYTEVTDESEGKLIDNEVFESSDQEVVQEVVQEEEIGGLDMFMKLMDFFPKRTMHEKLRYKYTTKLSKIVQYWMKELNLRGLDYYRFLMMIVTFVAARGHELMNMKRKNKKKRPRMSFVENETSSEESSSENDNPFLAYLEEIKKQNPQLIENLKVKEKDRQERKLLNIQKLEKATNSFLEEIKKRDFKPPGERMCFLERKDTPEMKEMPSLDEFLKKEGFPAKPPQRIPSEIFKKFGTDRESWEKDFPLMDEDDLKEFYDCITCQEDDVEEEDEGIFKLRGRFPFKLLNQDEGEEEEDVINLAEWEQQYWKHRSEEEGKMEEEDLELCQLVLVRSGTSWKQELGYTEGWTNTDRLGKKGRRDMEEVAIKIMKRGYKFDYVLTSTLGRSWRTADLMLTGSGQENMGRRCCWELNPRHQGKLEGQTDLGSASRWGWLPQEWFAFTTPPPIGARDPMPHDIASADPKIPDTLPRAENVFHVQLRVESVWDLLKQLFKEEGKRTILVCAHKDSIEALLFHIHGFCPTDFTAWQPSYTTPIILMWYRHGEKFFPAFIDFLCGLEEAERHTENLTICWFERFIDQGLLDYKTLEEIKNKMNNNKEPPNLKDLWDKRFKETVSEFEANAKNIGRNIRQMNLWLERGYVVTPEENLKVTNDNTVFKEFMDHLETIEKAKDPLSDVLTLEEQILWIVNRKIMPLELKLKNLKHLWEYLLEDTNPETKEMLRKFIEKYEKVHEEQTKLKQSIINAQRSPEEKFKENPPQHWSDLKTPEDWRWAAWNNKFPGGVKIPRKLLFKNIDPDSSDLLEEETGEQHGEQKVEEEEVEENP